MESFCRQTCSDHLQFSYRTGRRCIKSYFLEPGFYSQRCKDSKKGLWPYLLYQYHHGIYHDPSGNCVSPVFRPGRPGSCMALVWLIQNKMPPVMGIILAESVLAACMSCADTHLNCAAANYPVRTFRFLYLRTGNLRLYHLRRRTDSGFCHRPDLQRPEIKRIPVKNECNGSQDRYDRRYCCGHGL